MPDPHFGNVPAYFKEIASGDTPSAGQISLYAKTDGKMYYKDDAGVETEVGGGGGGESAIGITIDGAGSAITTGDKGSISIPYNATLNDVTMIADVSGVCIVDILKSNFTTYPTSSSICSTSLPTISGEIKSIDSNLVGWDVNIQSGDVLNFQVLSAINITKLTLTMGATKY